MTAGIETSRLIVRECSIDATRSEVWQALTTTGGVTTFFAPEAKIELRLDGPYELYFLADGEPGSRGSEGCRVLSFLSEEMLSFTWNAPPHLPEVRYERTFVVIQLCDLDNGKTGVKVTHAGWKRGGQWDEAFAYFEEAWSIVLGNLQKRFISGPLWPTDKTECC